MRNVDPFYSTAEWRELREQVIARDGGRCTVARLLGGSCSGALHVHHIVPVRERYDLRLDEENCATVCSTHHPRWEALRRFVAKSDRELPPCGHRHPYRIGRIACENERRKRLGLPLIEYEPLTLAS